MSRTQRNVTADHSDAPSNDDTDSIRPSKICRGLDGEMMTVAVILSGADLRRLGINPTETDAVRPRIQSGVVLIEAV